MPHNIFLSYSRKDIDIMRRLRDDLRAAGFTVWTDEGIEPGTPSWKSEIENAIRATDCQVIIFSPDANTSRWVRAEIDFAETLHKPMFPLLVSGDETTSIPFGFSTYQWIDLRQPSDYDTGFRMLTEAIQHKLKLPAGTAPIQTARMFKQTTPAATSEPAPAPSGGVRRVLYIIGIAATVLVALMGIILPQFAPALTNATPTPPAPTSVPTLAALADWPDDCNLFSPDLTFDKVDTPTMTIPGGWVQLQSEHVTIAVPSAYYFPPDMRENFWNVMTAIVMENVDPSEYEANCAWNIELFFGQMSELRGGSVMSRRVGMPLSLEAQKSFYIDLVGEKGVLEAEVVSLPAGEMLHVKTTAGADDITALGTTYSFASGPMLYNISFAFAADTLEGYQPIIDQIMQTFRVIEEQAS